MEIKVTTKVIELKDLGNYGIDINGGNGHWVERIQEERDELAAFEPLCEIKVFVEIEYCDDEWHFRHWLVRLEYNGVLLNPIKKSYNVNSYQFFLHDGISNRDMQRDFRYKNPIPNYVGKPTKKKMDEWLSYLMREKADILEREHRADSVRRDFLNTLSGYKIYWKNKNEGEIEVNKVIFSFSIYEKSISTKISFRYDAKQDLNTFEKILKALGK